MMDRLVEQNRILEETALMTDISAPDDPSDELSMDSFFNPSFHTHGSSSTDDSSVSTDSSATESCSSTSMDSFDNLGPPPPGSLMDLWDKPIPPCSFNDLYDCFIDGIATVDETTPTAPLSDDESSISSAASLDVELHQTPTLKFVSATNRLAFGHDSGELIDTGGNFCMCNDLNMLVNVFPITPFGISMAASQEKSEPMCTHRGDFPIPMVDGSTYYTPMYYNPTASDCILSPQAICTNSKGYLTRWSQEGQISPLSGSVVFYNKHDKPIIKLNLQHRNGLFYTTTEATAIDHSGEDIEDCSNRTRKRIGMEEDTESEDTSPSTNSEIPSNHP